MILAEKLDQYPIFLLKVNLLFTIDKNPLYCQQPIWKTHNTVTKGTRILGGPTSPILKSAPIIMHWYDTFFCHYRASLSKKSKIFKIFELSTAVPKKGNSQKSMLLLRSPNHNVRSSNTSCLEAHAGFFKLLIKEIFDPCVLRPFDSKLII